MLLGQLQHRFQVYQMKGVLWIKTPRPLTMCRDLGFEVQSRGIRFSESWNIRHIQIYDCQRMIDITMSKPTWFGSKYNQLYEHVFATGHYRSETFQAADQSEFLSMVSQHIQSNYRLVDSACRWNSSMIGLRQSCNWHDLDGVPGITDGEILVVPRQTPQRFIGDDLFRDTKPLRCEECWFEKPSQ